MNMVKGSLFIAISALKHFYVVACYNQTHFKCEYGAIHRELGWKV